MFLVEIRVVGIFFFFSSRRLHTRCYRDWSSDVCSSDLAGVAAPVAAQTLVATYNDLTSVASLLDAHKAEVAAVIVEPVAANMGVILPAPGFLAGLRQLTHDAGALLIFDEVITGFRV